MASVSHLPYRCPRCGGQQDFVSLSALKAHLMAEHQHLMTPSGSYMAQFDSPLLSAYQEEAKGLEKELEDMKEAELQNKLQRRGAQLDSAKNNLLSILDMQQSARHQSPSALSANPVISRVHTPVNSPAKVRSDNRNTSINDAKNRSLFDTHNSSLVNGNASLQRSDASQNTNTQNTYQQYLRNLHGGDRRQLDNRDTDINSSNLSRSVPEQEITTGLDLYNDYIKTLHGENTDNSKAREQQIEMSQALSQAKQHVDTLKKNADKFTEEQQETIRKLKDELKKKDKALGKAKKELHNLTAERRQLQSDVVGMTKKNDKTEEKLSNLQDEIISKEALVDLKAR